MSLLACVGLVGHKRVKLNELEPFIMQENIFQSSDWIKNCPVLTNAQFHVLGCARYGSTIARGCRFYVPVITCFNFIALSVEHHIL